MNHLPKYQFPDLILESVQLLSDHLVWNVRLTATTHRCVCEAFAGQQETMVGEAIQGPIWLYGPFGAQGPYGAL